MIENITLDRLCMKTPWNPNASLQRCLNALFQHIVFLFSPFFWAYLSFQVRINKMVECVNYHTYPARLVIRIHPSLFLKLLRTLSLQNGCWIFSRTCIFHHGWKNFHLWSSHSWKCIESRNSYSCRSSHLNLSPKFLSSHPR